MMMKSTLMTLCAVGFAVTAGTLGASAAQAAGVPQCSNSDLRAALVNVTGAAGSRVGDLRFTNVARGTCTTRGYPGVSYVGDGNGTQIGRAATWDSGTVRTITLRPGQYTASPIRMVNVQNYPAATCRPKVVDGLRVYVPGSTLAKFIPYRTTGCLSTKVTTIDVKPVGS